MVKHYEILYYLLVLIILITGCNNAGHEERSLLVYCGAGMKNPVSEIVRDYEKESGMQINLVYGGSEMIFAKIEFEKTGDIFMPGSELYLNHAIEKKYIHSHEPVAMHIPVIMVTKGNPKKIHSINDLSENNISLSLGKKNACAICNLVPEILSKAGIYKKVYDNAVITTRSNVNELAVDVLLGEADATIVWYSNALAYVKQGKAEIIEIDDDLNIKKTVPVAVLNMSENIENAVRFKDYIVSRKDIWERYGYKMMD